MARHDTVMRLLIRRYVTAEQRKRDQFGITEDDVMEIRQDISTLRYELIDILRQNGMRTPMLEKQDAASKFTNCYLRLYWLNYCMKFIKNKKGSNKISIIQYLSHVLCNKWLFFYLFYVICAKHEWEICYWIYRHTYLKNYWFYINYSDKKENF